MNNFEVKIPKGGIPVIARKSGVTTQTVRNVLAGVSNNLKVLREIQAYLSTLSAIKEDIVQKAQVVTKPQEQIDLTTIHGRLSHFIELLGISKGSFARSIHTSTAMVSIITTRERDFQCSFLLKIIEAYPELNVEWLLTGNGNITKTNTTVN